MRCVLCCLFSEVACSLLHALCGAFMCSVSPQIRFSRDIDGLLDVVAMERRG